MIFLRHHVMSASTDFSIRMIFRLLLLTNPNPQLVTVGAWVERTGALELAQSLRFQVFISGDNRLDSVDLTRIDRMLNFSPNSNAVYTTITFDLRTTAMARGSMIFLGRIDPDNLVAETNELNNAAMIRGSALGTDVVLDWISNALTAVMCEGQQGRGVGPTTGTRLMAMLSTAIYDTVCGFNATQTPYRFDLNAPSGASIRAAVIGAASRILGQLLPGQADFIQSQAAASLANVGSLSDNSISSGLSFGQQMADRVITDRAADGSANTAPYIAPDRADGYVWRPQLSGPTAGVALGPQWGEVKPFAISNVQAYMPVGGLEARPDVNYAKYLEQLQEVRSYGALTNTATTTVLRTADQTQMAKFWACDRPETYRPYGQLNQIAIDLSLQSGGLSIERNAALFAALNVALADAVLVAWKAKYTELQPRPFDLITGQQVDANGNPVAPAAVIDREWKSLLSEINGVQSPPFPDYLSGHSAMGGVFASVMTKYFGDNRPFDAYSQDLDWAPMTLTNRRSFNGYVDANGVTRNSFYQAGWEDALSRVYGGVHIREACEDSFFMGQQVGNAVISQPRFQAV